MIGRIATQRAGSARLHTSRHGATPQQQRCRLLPKGRAASDSDAPNVMTLERAYRLLQVTEKHKFDEIVEQKNKLINSSKDQDRVMELEAAYDILFMANMKKRLTGELEVSTSVRYADVPAAPKKSSRTSSATSPRSTLAPSLPRSSGGGLGISLTAPRNTSVAATQAGVFGALAVVALGQALLESPDAQLAETAGLPLALALAYAIYSLKENKGMQLGKAAGCTMACLVGGSLVGSIVEAWLRVDIVPILGFGSPGTLVAEFIIAACAGGAIFLV